jgi:hypothetical protein
VTANVTVTVNSASGGNFHYGTLASPVTLNANTDYYILSQETNGGDQWYDDNTTLTASAVGNVAGSVFGSGSPYNIHNVGSFGYVPVDFQYQSGGGGTTNFVSSKTLGTLRNNFSGWVGMQVHIGALPITLTTLGRMFASGNSQSHTVKIVLASTGSDVSGASVTIAASTDITPPSTPTNLTGTSTSISSVNLSWTASTDNVGVVGYQIYREGVLIGNSAGPSYTDNTVISGNSYSYAVVAYDAAGNLSAQSAPISVQVLINIYTLAITSNVVSGITAHTVTITWTSNIPTTGTVYYDTVNSSNLRFSAANNISDTIHIVNLVGLNRYTRYYYRIVATDGNSFATSATKSFRTARR